MNCGDGLHAEVVRQESRNVGESSAVTCVDDDQECDAKDNDLILDAARQDRCTCESDGEDEDDLVNDFIRAVRESRE